MAMAERRSSFPNSRGVDALAPCLEASAKFQIDQVDGI